MQVQHIQDCCRVAQLQIEEVLNNLSITHKESLAFIDGVRVVNYIDRDTQNKILNVKINSITSIR